MDYTSIVLAVFVAGSSGALYFLGRSQGKLDATGKLLELWEELGNHTPDFGNDDDRISVAYLSMSNAFASVAYAIAPWRITDPAMIPDPFALFRAYEEAKAKGTDFNGTF